MVTYSVAVSLVSMKLLTLCQPNLNRGTFILNDYCQTVLVITLLLVLIMTVQVIPRSDFLGGLLITMHLGTVAVLIIVVRQGLQEEHEFWSYLGRRILNPKRQTVTTKFGLWNQNMTSFMDDDDSVRFEKGDAVMIVKLGHHYGAMAVVTDGDWNGMVKVDIDGETKSYIHRDLRRVNAGADNAQHARAAEEGKAKEDQTRGGRSGGRVNFTALTAAQEKQTNVTTQKPFKSERISWQDRGVRGVPKKKPSSSTKPEPFAIKGQGQKASSGPGPANEASKGNPSLPRVTSLVTAPGISL